MSTCFLFVQNINENGCLSLRLTSQGQIEAALEHRNFEAIRALQHNASTVVVASSGPFTMHCIQLPALSEKKVRTAIPYALEDQLAQDINELHFVISKHHSKNNTYLVAVCSKQYLQELISNLNHYLIHFETLTLDWFALQPNEICQLQPYWMINNDFFQGALSLDLVPFYLKKLTEPPTVLTFLDSPSLEIADALFTSIAIPDTSCNWIAKRLQRTKLISLCQGELRHPHTRIKTKRWYQAALLMSALWLTSILVVNIVKYYHINSEIKQLDKKIYTIYQEFFPGSHQVISAKFRISQLLKNTQMGHDASFWTILDKLSTIIKTDTTTVNQLIYKDKKIIIALAFKNFEGLESLQAKLQQNHLHIKQTQASTQDGVVIATMELSL